MEQLGASSAVGRVFGEPFERPGGDLVLPVVKVTGRGGDTVTPLGVFVIHDGKATWESAVDVNQKMLLSRLAWLVPATLVAVAMIRRAPWPDMHMRLVATLTDGRLPRKTRVRLERSPKS